MAEEAEEILDFEGHGSEHLQEVEESDEEPSIEGLIFIQSFTIRSCEEFICCNVTLGDDVTSLLRTTVNQLEDALHESRELLIEKDKELECVHAELEKCRTQVTKEIVNKTKLAQSLNETEQQARELEGVLQEWQLELRESVQQRERSEKMLEAEKKKHTRTKEELEQTRKKLSAKEKEAEQLRAQLAALRSGSSSSLPTSRKAKSESDSEGMDSSRLNFLKQAVYHYLIDYHADEQVRAIVSMLDFNPEERKKVYAKQQERKQKGTYMS